MDAGDLFNRRAARRDLRRYRSRGASPTTRLLIDALLTQRDEDRNLMDVGGGVGVISHELLGAGFSESLQVDASLSYLSAAEEEASRRGHREQLRVHYGDFVELAPDLPSADVVTLDRVVCCYPDMERLVTASAGKAGHLYGLVLPRVRLLTRVSTFLANAWFRIRGSDFRTYLHPVERVEATVERCGFRRTFSGETLLWRIVTYARL